MRCCDHHAITQSPFSSELPVDPAESQTPAVGEPLTPGARPHEEAGRVASQVAASATALALARQAAILRGKSMVHVASSERRAEEIGRALAGVSPAVEVLVLPPWDCLPYDRPPPPMT